jgi:hypothetical protein
MSPSSVFVESQTRLRITEGPAWGTAILSIKLWWGGGQGNAKAQPDVSRICNRGCEFQQYYELVALPFRSPTCGETGSCLQY